MKPYFIFIEGGNIPHAVHMSEIAAITEAKRLAKTAVGKKIYLLKITKRFISENGELVENIGSHIVYPTMDNLVRYNVANPDKLTLTVVNKKRVQKEKKQCAPAI